MSGIVALVLAGQAHADDPAANRIDLYEYTAKYPLSSAPPELRPVPFNVPEAYRFGSSKNAAKAWSIEILTFYPSFEPASNEANRDLGLNCAGICDGRILITIEYRPAIANTGSPNMGDFVARARLKLQHAAPLLENVTIRDLEGKYGFDEAAEKSA